MVLYKFAYYYYYYYHIRYYWSVVVSIALSLLPFLSYLTLNNIVALKSELRSLKIMENGTIQKSG